MNKNIFIACDTNKTSTANKIIKYSNTKKLKIGYKFGLEFINSKNGRAFITKIKDKIIFVDLKLNDIPNTCASAVKAIKDLKVNYLTIHVSSGLEALKATKKVCGKIKLVGVTTLTSINDYSFLDKISGSTCPCGLIIGNDFTSLYNSLATNLVLDSGSKKRSSFRFILLINYLDTFHHNRTDFFYYFLD